MSSLDLATTADGAWPLTGGISGIDFTAMVGALDQVALELGGMRCTAYG